MFSPDSTSAETQQSDHLPAVYRLPDGERRGLKSPVTPRVVYIESTNHCNLRCETCPRTYSQPEPLKTLSRNEFIRIAEQFPEMRRVLLHGIGEPLLNHQLPEIIAYLKERDVEVITNSNGTLLTPVWQEVLVRSRLDEYRCSIDAAHAEKYARIRGADALGKVLDGLKGLVEARRSAGSKTPRISIWTVATQENLAELPQLVDLAYDVGADEIYVQRLVFFGDQPEAQYGMARRELTIFGQAEAEQDKIIAECEAKSARYGIDFKASGARDPRGSLAAARSNGCPWQDCMRPWTTAYVTANGNCLACCIAPFATQDYPSLILGNLLDKPFDEFWNGERYQAWRRNLLSQNPRNACAMCGVYWSL